MPPVVQVAYCSPRASNACGCQAGMPMPLIPMNRSGRPYFAAKTTPPSAMRSPMPCLRAICLSSLNMFVLPNSKRVAQVTLGQVAFLEKLHGTGDHRHRS